jgi:hypothetical protein
MRLPVNFSFQCHQDWQDRILLSPEQIGVNLTAGGNLAPIPTFRDHGRPLARRKAGQQIALESSSFARREGEGEALAAILDNDATKFCVGF